MFKSTVLFTAVAIIVGIPHVANATELASGAVKTLKTAKGDVVTDSKGLTLYTFDKDSKGTSVCYDDCAKKWPPLTASATAKASGAFSIVTRKDDSKQWAHDGKPLYFWHADKKPGDVSGDGIGGVWHVVKG